MLSKYKKIIVSLLLLLVPFQAWAAAAFRSSNSSTYASRTNLTLTAPTGIVNGDILIITFIIAAATPPTPTPPTGFAVIPGLNNPSTVTYGGFSVTFYKWYKVASSESGNYTITHASASSQGFIAAISGADTVTPFSPNATRNSGTGTTYTYTGLTTPRDGSLIMIAAHDWGDTSNALTPPTGTTPTFTERLDESATSIMYVATGVLTTAGATGNKTMTNNSLSADPWDTTMISIQPSGSGGTTANSASVSINSQVIINGQISI